MRRIALGALLLGLFVSPAWSDPYWIDWEGSDWPESTGYMRSWGNWNGQHQGGAIRTLENGVLTYDSLYDPGVYDYYYMYRPGQMDPPPASQFVMEWRLKVDQVTDDFVGDPGVAFSSDAGWSVAFTYTEDHLISDYEDPFTILIPFTPGVWHDYRLTTSDMRTYNLYIDNSLAREGAFVYFGFDVSYMAWGDFVQGAASLHHWDFFRYGTVVPEPSGFLLLCAVSAWRGVRRG